MNHPAQDLAGLARQILGHSLVVFLSHHDEARLAAPGDARELIEEMRALVAKRMGELDKMEQQLAAHRKANRLPADDYAEYLGKLNAMRDGLAGATSANDKYTMSAKAQAAALRGVPAQFTDIVVSLQAGQQPLQVLLQQGGQLKDMFGGIGPAARALGGYITGMINPFTLLAAAAAVLALAYKQGSAEQEQDRCRESSKGAGVFGEAGPEAIMPLTRAADGSLGVRALSGSQNTLPTAAAPIMIKTDVHVDAGGNATSSTDDSQAGDAGKQLGKMISDGALRVVQQQLATGGSIWRLVNGR